MNILLDTHILLWYLTDDGELSYEKSGIIEDTNNRLFFSIASLWEIAIKAGLLKLEIPKPIDILVPEEITILTIQIPHITTYQTLLHHHKDPFDRMLISQAIAENLVIMTNDAKFLNYPVDLI
jgi:PIN domain nuclease of toxin-antitoxin system